MPVRHVTALRTLRLAIEYKSRLLEVVPVSRPFTDVTSGVVSIGWYHLRTQDIARLRGVGITEDDDYFSDLADLVEAVQAVS